MTKKQAIDVLKAMKDYLRKNDESGRGTEALGIAIASLVEMEKMGFR